MESTFQRHLGTNYVPSPDEIKDIKMFIVASNKEIRDIDDEINLLEQRLHILQEKRCNVHSIIEQYQALISPVRRLDRDILQEIFLACLPDDRNPVMSAVEAPMLLTRICSSWRSVAHSTPQLWAAIHIVVPVVNIAFSLEKCIKFQRDLVQNKLEQRQVAVKEWLDRSHSCPLSISVYQAAVNIPTRHQHWVSDQMHQLQLSFINNTVVAYAQRLCDVDLRLQTFTLKNLFESGFATECLQMLRRLQFTCTSRPAPKLEWKNIVGLMTSPLTCVTFRGFDFSTSGLPQIPQLVGEHLTELTLNFVEHTPRLIANNSRLPMTALVAPVIRCCQSLKILNLHGLSHTGGPLLNTQDWEHETSSGGMPIVLPHLTTLSLAADESVMTRNFVKELYMPSLEHLDIQLSVRTGHGNVNEAPITLKILQILLCNCEESLQSLGLYFPTILTSEKDLVHLLRLTPNLRILRFSSTSLDLSLNMWGPPFLAGCTTFRQVINDDFLRALSPVGKEFSDVICPKLEVFECDYGVITDVSSAALRDFIINYRDHANVLDPQMFTLQVIRLLIDEFREMADTNEEPVSLGEGSVYFRKLEIIFSPWEGLEARRNHVQHTLFPYEAYNEL